MKNKLIFVIFLVLIFILVFFIQVYLISGKTLFGVKPNLFLISVIVFTIFIGIYKGSIYALLLGILCDFMYGSNFGIYTISYTFVAVIIGIISNNYRTETRLSQIIITFIGTATFEIIQFIIYSVLTSHINNILTLLHQIVIASLLNIIIVFIFNGVIKSFAEHFEIKSRKKEALY